MATHVAPAEGVKVRVAKQLVDFVDNEVLPGTGVESKHFWSGFDSMVHDLMPRNAALLEKRDQLQAAIDTWHTSGKSKTESSEAFLKSIGYLQEAPAPFEVTSANVDAEIATIGGPQLVCPVDNDRFILNAGNARWGSLLDAIYGTNAMLPAPPAGPYNPSRGAQVFDQVNSLLDDLFPLARGQWHDVTHLEVRDGALHATLGDSAVVSLQDGAQLAGYSNPGDGLGEGTGDKTQWSLLLQKHKLHCELVLSNPAAASDGRGHKAGLVDVRVESALSTICDFEDSACTVDAADKVVAYRNWLGLMNRSLACNVKKGGESFQRKLNAPRSWRAPSDGAKGAVTLPGQAVLLARNVGMHMYTDAATTETGDLVPEHFLDALVTAACALHDLNGHRLNSRTGSMYVVKPKMHGPEEVQLACDLFARVEEILGMGPNTMKMGVMDEERRTSTNLLATIQPAQERLVFVNTGFLDRTADEIHTSMQAGPVLPKANDGLKGPWYKAYEASNVETCMAAQLVGKGQIGKGMWAEPDDMHNMMQTKGAQIDAGASTAWVPSPTAATLHSLHYMRTSVDGVQTALLANRDTSVARGAALRAGLLTAPLWGEHGTELELTAAQVQHELDDNAQGLLGYVVRWVGQGVGCSKVPNLAGKQLMEDRATLRISSQLIANWMHHGVVSKGQVMETLTRVAKIVDEQNAHQAGYQAFAPSYDGPEWHAALELVFNGLAAPNGYTEPSLTKWRRARKALDQRTEAAAGQAEDAAWDRLAAQTGTEGRRGSSLGGAM